MKMKKAFTLAEVLLVIAIIGAVSVLSVNNAVKSTNSAEKITRLRKTYDVLQTAIMAGMDKGGSISNWGYALNNADNGNYNLAKKFIAPYLKIEKECGTGTGCWKTGTVTTTYREASSINIDNSTNMYKAILANGASIAITFCYINTRTANSSIGFNGIYPVGDKPAGTAGDIFVDVDGPNKGSSKMGDDVFLFYIVPENGLIPSGNNLAIKSNTDGQCPKYGEACTAWALHKGNQDYFKCPDQLSWTDPNKAHCQ